MIVELQVTTGVRVQNVRMVACRRHLLLLGAFARGAGELQKMEEGV